MVIAIPFRSFREKNSWMERLEIFLHNADYDIQKNSYPRIARIVPANPTFSVQIIFLLWL